MDEGSRHAHSEMPVDYSCGKWEGLRHSGGPILITRNNRKEVIGINWNSGGASGGSAAAAFDISDAGHSNLVSYLMDQIIHEPMGHGANSLDIEGDGMNEIVFYDASSGELRLMGIGAYARFHVRLVEQVAPNYQFLEVGDFDGDGLKKEIVLYRGDTGELCAYFFENDADNYYLIPWKRYTTFTNSLLPESVIPFGASATTSGDFNSDGTTELVLVDHQNNQVHVINVSTGRYLGLSTHTFFGEAQIFTSGRFSSESTGDWIAICGVSDSSTYSYINFFEPFIYADGSIVFSRYRRGFGILDKVSQMVRGRYDDDETDDLFVYRSTYRPPLEWHATVYTDVITGWPRTLMDRVLDRRYNMIIPGNFDIDDYDEIALWLRSAYTGAQASCYALLIQTATL